MITPEEEIEMDGGKTETRAEARRVALKPDTRGHRRAAPQTEEQRERLVALRS